MKSSGPGDASAAAPLQSCSSAGFVLGLGTDGPSPGRKPSGRARNSSLPSRILQRPAGVAGSSAAQPALDGTKTLWSSASHPAPANTGGQLGPMPEAHHVPARPQSTGSLNLGGGPVSSAANAEGSLQVPRGGTSGIPSPAQAGQPTPTFAVGASDGSSLGLRTPRGARGRANRCKHATSPLIAAPSPVAGGSMDLPFSPLGLDCLEAMTPIDANTYQKLGQKQGSFSMLGPESPMDITPQGSMVSAASNVFVFSPLVGGSFGGQAASNITGAGASASGAGLASCASSASTPFQGFPAVRPAVAPAAGTEGTATGAPAETVPPAASGTAVPSVSAPSAPAAASGHPSRPASAGGGWTNSSGPKFPIQIQIPGAREVQDMFTSAASASWSGAPSTGSGSRGTAIPGFSNGAAAPVNAAAAAAAAPAAPQQQGSSQASRMAAAVAAAAARKLPDTDAPVPVAASAAAKGELASTVAGGSMSNDCQPPKDNAPKATRISIDTNGTAATSSRSSIPHAPFLSSSTTPKVGIPSASDGTAPQPPASTNNVATAAAALGLAAASAAAVASVPPEATSSPPDILAAVAEQLEYMARRTREAAAAAAAARAISGSANPTAAVDAVAAALARESNPAVRSVVEIMLRPGALDAKVAAAAAAAKASASETGPGLAAVVACMLGALKLEDSRPMEQQEAAAAAGSAPASSGAAASTSGSDGSRGSSAGGAPAVPFVFGGNSSGGSSANSSFSQGGPGAPAAPSVPVAFGQVAATAAAVFGNAPAAAAPASTAAPGATMARPSTAPATAASQHHPQQQPSMPFVFGVPGVNGQSGAQAGTSAVSGPSVAQTNSVPATFGRSTSSSQVPPMEQFTTIESTSSVPFMFSANSAPQPQQFATNLAAESQQRGANAASQPQEFSANPAPQSQQPAAGQPTASASHSAASFMSGASSPMSTTPMSASHQSAQSQPTASATSSGWTAGAPPAGTSPSAEAFAFTVGGVGSAASNGGATPGRVVGRPRAKITPRKTRTCVPTDSTPVSRSSGGGFGAPAPPAPPANGGPAAAPAVQAPAFAAGPSGQPAAATAAGAAAAAPQQASKSQSTSGAADSGLDPAAVEAVRIKREADEKKQYGNQKYENSDFRSAERWYSEAIELLENKLQQLGLARERLQQLFPNLKTEIAVLYSNRSGARLMTSKPHSALADALRAMDLDPKFMRAASRAATCYCRLGDFAAAHRIIDSAMDRCSASSSHYQDMLKKLNEVVDLGARARAATAAAVSAVAGGSRDKLQEAVDQLVAIRDQVGYCEVVAAARAVLALRLGVPREVLALVAPHPEVPPKLRAAPWRLWLTIQAHYFKGDLQEAMTTCRELQYALEAAGPESVDSNGGSNAASAQEQEAAGGAAAATAYATTAHVTVPPPAVLGELGECFQQLLRLKEEGNAAIKQNRLAEAAELYTRALGMSCCPAYAAVLHANRAAAHAGQGALADAVADCGRARALDPSYHKASSRLASYMAELRRPEDAQGLLEPLFKLGSQGNGSGLRPEELNIIKERLSEARSSATWQKTPHHYKLLGLVNNCSEEDVKKAYRRLALKHHPDKALAAVKVSLALPGRAGGAPYSGPLVGSAELEARVREEAAWLFNFINQAHEELSDKVRRRKVDQLLEVEQPPRSGRYGNGSSNMYGGGWFNGSGTRGNGFSDFYGVDPFFFHRPGGPAPAGGGGGVGGAGGSSRSRSATGGGAGAAGGGYGGYGSYAAYGGGSRPGSARQSSGANNNAANGNGPTRSSNSSNSNNGPGAARGGTGAGGGAGGTYAGGYGRAAGAGPRQAAGGRKWWEGGNDNSDDDDEDTFNF